MTEGAYRELCDEMAGLCLACGDTTNAPVEPDAEGYTCEACRMPSVMGLENALIAGHLELT